MRTLTLTMALVLSFFVPTYASEMTDLERRRLVAHMEMTGAWLIDEVSNLSPQQLEFRPAPGSWSVMEVLEHLIVVGPIYWNDLQKALKTPATERMLSSGDANILWYGIDRTRRETALTSETPKGQLHDLTAALDTYRKQHARLLQYVKTTKDDLRSHIVERQGSDAYQWALLISTHEQRHILQIREIKADPKFPGAAVRHNPQTGKESPLAGTWVANLAKSKQSERNRIQRATVQIAVTTDAVTMSTRYVDQKGQERSATETFPTDGTDAPSTQTPGLVLAAKWVDSRVLSTQAKLDGKVVAMVLYEVSGDGKTLTSKSAGMVSQVLVFDRQLP
jgi:hypothetical protein